MVFDQRPDEAFLEITQRSLEIFKTTVQGISTVIRTGDEMLGQMDDALTGGRPKFGETPAETFEAVFNMLTATLEDAREKKSASDASVVQKSREILARVNAVEPPWRAGPVSMTTPSDVFRMALRDLRASNSLILLAQGSGEVEDLEQLGKWAGDLNDRINQVRESTGKKPAVTTGKRAAPARSTAPEAPKEPARPAPAKKPKKDTTPKTKPQEADVQYAQLVAEELADEKVTGWQEEFAQGKISEAQWISRLTSHCHAHGKDLDAVIARAETRMKQERNGQ